MDPCKTSNHSYDTIPGLWSGVRNVMVGCSQCDTPPLAEPSRYSQLPKAALIPDSIRTGALPRFSMAEYLGLAGPIVGPGLVRRRRLAESEGSLRAACMPHAPRRSPCRPVFGIRKAGRRAIPAFVLTPPGLCVLVEEFELDAQHVVEALAALVDVVAAAAVAMELAAGGLSPALSHMTVTSKCSAECPDRGRMTLELPVLMVRASVLGFVEPHEPEQAIGADHREKARDLASLAG